MKKLLLALISLAVSCSAFAEKYDFVVAKDGSGNFKTVQEAINAVPDYRKIRTVIFIKKGVYKEKLILPESKSMVSFVGESRDSTILTYDDYASKPNSFGENKGTSGSASFYVYGPDFRAENITFENSSGPVGQAVAILVRGDRAAFFNCRFMGFQDTLYAYGDQNGVSRQYYKNCYIEGTVDFIFGWATAWFEQCTLFGKNGGYFTAASTPESSPYGFVFNHCKVTGNALAGSFYLGRPWRPFSAVIFMNTEMSSIVTPEGWHNWNKPDAGKTARYFEYHNTGEGANPDKRVTWSKQLSEEQAAKITIDSVLGGTDQWIPETEKQ